MSFEEKIQALSAKARNQSATLLTEEAAKTALVMPFINILGYDVFDPAEVVPEFVADVGVKKGEKVDYAIKRNGEIIIIFECKPASILLDDTHRSQLYRYFSVTKAKFAFLTNGLTYQIYTDLDEKNKLDQRPFIVFDIIDPKPHLVAELKKFSKDVFDVNVILATANNLKYISETKSHIQKQFENPSDALVKIFAGLIHDGRVTGSVRGSVSNFIKLAFREIVADHVNQRLSTALASNAVEDPAVYIGNVTIKATADEDIVTLDEEREGFFVVKAIVRSSIRPDRVFIRDQKTYCGILIDDNNRKPLARLHFNRTVKYLGLFDGDDGERRVPIDSIDDIYKHADALIATCKKYPAEVDG